MNQHGLPFLQPLPFRNGNFQPPGFIRIERGLPRQCQPEAEARNTAVIHRECPDFQPDDSNIVTDGRQFMQHHRIAQRRHDDAQPFHHPFQPLRSPDMKGFVPPGFLQAQQQPGQPGAVVSVIVGHQQPVQAPEPPAQPADPHLGSFSAVNEKRPAVHPYIQGGQRPVGNREGSAGSQCTEFQQRYPSSPKTYNQT